MEKMPPISKLTSKYQATIPLAVRKKLGLKKGDLLRFVENKNHEIVIRPMPALDAEEWGYLKLLDETLTEWHGSEDDDLIPDNQSL